MAAITFEMKDKHGRDAEVGDVIKASFPEVLIESPDGIDFYRPETVVLAKIYLPPAKGLQIKVLDIVSENYEGDHYYGREELDAKTMPLRVGDMKQFKRTVLDWEILDERSAILAMGTYRKNVAEEKKEVARIAEENDFLGVW